VVKPKYPLLHQQPVFTESKFIDIARLNHLPRESLPTYGGDELPRTTVANATLVQLPPFPSADWALLDQYATAFEKVLANAVQIRSQPAA
jgi:hypothetical protein